MFSCSESYEDFLNPLNIPVSKSLIVSIHSSQGFPDGSVRKKFTYNAEDTGDPSSILGVGRSSGGGNGNSLQYSGLENPTDRGAWWATIQRITKSRTWLSNRAHSTSWFTILNKLHNIYRTKPQSIKIFSEKLPYFITLIQRNKGKVFEWSLACKE